MVKVKTHVLVPYNDLTMHRALNRDFCPKRASLQFLQGGLPFSQSSHLFWEFHLLGKHCSDSAPSSQIVQRHWHLLPWAGIILAWFEGLEVSLQNRTQLDPAQSFIIPFQAMAQTWSPRKWVAMFLLTIWGPSFNLAASELAIHFLLQQSNTNTKPFCHVVMRGGK